MGWQERLECSMSELNAQPGRDWFSATEIEAAGQTAEELGFILAINRPPAAAPSIEVAPFVTAPGTPLEAWDIDGVRSEGRGVWSIFKDPEADTAIAKEHGGGKGRRLTEDTPAAALRSIAILHEAEDGTYLG
jgi:hypothetical protein